MSSLFDDVETTTPIIDPNKNYFEELVGENKKFKDPVALARGKMEADILIESMKRENAELRSDFLKAKEETVASTKLQELIDQLNAKMLAASNSENNHNTNEGNNVPAFKAEDLDKAVEAKLNAFERQRKEQANFNEVQTKLKEQFGDSVGSVLSQKMTELGLDKEDIDALARKSPKGFFNTLGLSESTKVDPFAPPKSQLRNDSFAPKTQDRTWSWWQDFRKKNPTLYHDPKHTSMRHSDLIRLGNAFKDGDFNL
jgi:hypothetical protein